MQKLAFAIVVIVLTVSCKKNGKSDINPATHDTVAVIPKLNRIIVDSTVSILLSTEQELANGIFKYDRLPGIEKIKKGDLLIEPRNYGYLRKVQSVLQSNGLITIASSQGTLSELYKDSGDVKIEINFADSTRPFQKAVDRRNRNLYGVAAQQGAAETNVLMPDFDISLGPDKGTLSFKNVSFSFQPNFELDYNIEKKNLEIGFKGAVTGLKYKVSYATDLDKGEDLTLEKDLTAFIPKAARIIPFYYGIIAGYAEVQLKLESKVEGSAKLVAGFEYEKSTTTNAYVKVENGVIGSEMSYSNPVDEGRFNFDFIGELASTIKLVPSFKIYIFNVPLVNLGVGLSVNGDVNFNFLTGLWNSEVSASGSLEGNFDGTLFDFLPPGAKFSKELVKHTFYEAPKTLSLLSPLYQSGHLNEELSEPVELQVLGSNNDPQGPVRVFFSSDYGKWEKEWIDAKSFDGKVSNRFTVGDVDKENVLTACILNAKGDTIDRKNVYVAITEKTYSIKQSSGDNQTGYIGRPLRDLLLVKVLDDQNKPAQSIVLRWSANNGSISGSSLTNPDGEGNGTWTLGETPGPQTVTVRAIDGNGKEISGSPLTFRATGIKAGVPILTTSNISSVTQTTAISGGSITNDGGASITARGVCWSVSQDPTIADSKTSDGLGSGSFISNLTGLTMNVTYHARAYATNSAGTAYGDDVAFTTKNNDLNGTTWYGYYRCSAWEPDWGYNPIPFPIEVPKGNAPVTITFSTTRDAEVSAVMAYVWNGSASNSLWGSINADHSRITWTAATSPDGDAVPATWEISGNKMTGTFSHKNGGCEVSYTFFKL